MDTEDQVIENKETPMTGVGPELTVAAHIVF